MPPHSGLAHIEMTDAETLYLLGNRRMADGDAAGAEACFREAIRLDPRSVGAWCNLGIILERAARLDEAENCYRRALEIDSGHAQIHANLGILLARKKRFDEAERAYRQALALDPDSPATWSNLGVLHASLHRDEEAEQCHRHALALDPEYRKARFNLSYLLLRQEKFEEGWACMEARDWFIDLSPHVDCPRWQGEPVHGKSVLIGWEGGHGDMIQFCRFATELKQQGAARIGLICHPALKRLFRTLEGVDDLYSYEESVPASGWDWWTPPYSIPYYLKTRIGSIPAKLPYLAAEPADLRAWKRRLPEEGLRIGLVWKGSVQFENDADRSLPGLDILASLGELSGMRFISLQKGQGEEEARHPPAGLPLFDAGPMLGDFADTAAVIANLDLVISVDTAVAHLAGALGKPCWLMLPAYKPDWRWFEGRNDSPWYPGALRLFRQSQAGEWMPVVREIRAALECFRPLSACKES